jgi:predicted ester cyclase
VSAKAAGEDTARSGGGAGGGAAGDDRTARNRELARRFREDLWNSGDLAIADAIIAPDCQVHARVPLATDFVRGPDALRQLVLFYHLAFTDIRMTVDEAIAEGDTVAARWTGRGRHRGELLGLPVAAPADSEIVTTGIDFLRFAGGQIVEGWVAWDILSLVERLLPAGADADAVSNGPLAEFLPLLKRLR